MSPNNNPDFTHVLEKYACLIPIIFNHRVNYADGTITVWPRNNVFSPVVVHVVRSKSNKAISLKEFADIILELLCRYNEAMRTRAVK